MKQQPEYRLSTSSTLEDVVDVIKNLERDAKAAAAVPALTYARYGTPESRVDANFFLGQAEILKSLFWALSGLAESEGVSDPTVDIR